MKKLIFALSINLLCLAASYAGEAVEKEAAVDNLVFIPSIALQEKRLSFKQKESGIVNGHGEFTANIPMLDVSLTTAFHKWYLTLKYDHDLTETNVGTDETKTVSGSGSFQYFWQPPGTTMPVGREDKNITLGYNVVDGLSLFVGYMKGTTTISPPPTCQNPVVQPGPPGPLGTSIYCQSYNYSWLRLRTNDTFYPGVSFPDYVQTYSEEGPYLGFSYAHAISDIGTLSISVAYAEMSGNFKDNIGAAGLDARGNVYGTSTGITWIQPFTESSAYFIDLRQQSYSMNSVDKNFGGEFHTNEVMTSLTLGMQFYL